MRLSQFVAALAICALAGGCGEVVTGPIRTFEPGGVDAPVLLAAGDIANCSTQGDEQTADLIATQEGTVLTLGDNAYERGSPAEFVNCYHPSWGRHRARTAPSPGNHDYRTADAVGYFAYFGANAGHPDRGYYSFDLASWHIVSLNSNVDMEPGSEQERWLREDLAANQTHCTLAYWHHPRFSSGRHGNSDHSEGVVQTLYELGADVVLTGHDHHYERFVPTNPSGQPEPGGLVHFVVGTGGTGLRSVGSTLSTSAAMIDDSWGVLRLTLADSSYTHEFLPVGGGEASDSGSADCR